MSASSEYLSALTELSGQKAQAQAQASRQRGQIIGTTLQSLGQIIPQIQQARQQQQDRAALNQDRVAQAKLRDLQTQEAAGNLQQQQANQQGDLAAAQATSDLLQPQPDGSVTFDPVVAMQRMSAAGVPIAIAQKHLQALKEMNDLGRTFQATKVDRVAELADSFLRTHQDGEPVDPQALGLFADFAQKNGMTDQGSADALKQAAQRGGDPRKMLEGIRNLSPKFAKEDKPAPLVPIPGPDGKPIYGTPTAGAPVYEKPPAGAPERLVPVPGPNGKPVYGTPQAGAPVYEKPPSAGSGGADGTPALTPEAIEDTAVKYRILGTNAIPTRIEGDERVRIMNEASKQTRALGQTAAQSLQKQAAFKADAASLALMTKLSDSANASETKALAQADLISSLSKKVSRTSSPLFNSWLLSGKKTLIGDTDTSLLFNALDTFTSEYGKIMSGATASVAGAGEGSTRKAEGLISAAMKDGTLQKTIDQMKWEMDQTNKGYGATIEHISDRLGSGQTPSSTPPPVAPPTGRYNPATRKVE